MTISAIDHTLATVGAPVEGGCCWVSFAANPTVPTDATTDMDTFADFESVGELSNNGYTESKSVSTTDHTGWHGTNILTTVDSETNKYKAEFTEVRRAAVAKLRHGPANVDETDGVVNHISGQSAGAITCALVFDELQSNGDLRRTVCPKATVTNFDDVSHKKGELMLYGMEFTAAEVDGSSYEIYYATPTTTTTTTTTGA